MPQVHTPDYLPLNSQSHSDHHWQPELDYRARAQDSLVPLAFDELSSAAGSFVLSFIKGNQGYQLVALLGPGFNAYLHPQDKRWLGTYVPAKFRGSPFELGHDPEDPNQPLLCIQKNALIAPQDQADYPNSHRLFSEPGVLSSQTAAVFNFLYQRLKGQLALEKVIPHLNAIPNLIEPWSLSLPTADQPQAIKGLYRINETTLKNLSPDQLHDLNQHQGLAVAYAQLISTAHLRELHLRCEHFAPHNTNPEVDLDQLFGEASNDSFKF